MSSLLFALKFSMTLFVLSLHFGLTLLFLVSFIVHSGKSTEGIAIGVEAILVFMIPIRLWYYWARYRRMTIMQRMRRAACDERIFVISLWTLSLANAIWISVHALTLPQGFAGLARPDFAAVAAITLIWLAWSCSIHLIWIIVQEETSWIDDEPQPIRWPSVPATPYTPEPARHYPTTRDGRVSAKIVAIQHGSPPELWAKTKGKTPREALTVPAVQPARPTYDPKARQLREPPPIKTSQYQWYFTPGEAF